MNNTVRVFKDKLKRMLKEAKDNCRYFQLRGQKTMADVYFGRADTLREVIDWSNILED